MQRKLTAILSADMVGYSGLMEADEPGTLSRLKNHRTTIFEPQVTAHGGRVFKFIGDGILAEFPSVVEAVNCALAIQDEMTRAADDKRIRYRIGINLGDIIIDGDDIYGDGVNVASRLQALAPVGGVAVSAIVRDQMQGKAPCTFQDMGEHKVKNLERPVHVFTVAAPGAATGQGQLSQYPQVLSRIRPTAKLSKWTWTALGAAGLTIALVGGLAFFQPQPTTPVKGPTASDALKIAVLPFDALSAGQDMRYFADSLQDEIAGVLSSNEIQPVSRDMSAELRGPNARQAVERLGARLIIDGTVRSDGKTARVRVHLDDPYARVSLWSREYEADATATALLQSRVAFGMVAVLACAREALRPSGGLSDPSLVSRYLRACDVFSDWDVHQGYDAKGYAEWLETQRILTVKAPTFAPAQYHYATFAALAAMTSSSSAAVALRREAGLHLDRGMALDPKAPDSFAVQSVLVHQTDWSERERFLRRAVAVAPSWSLGNLWLGVMLAETGRVREGVEFAQRAAAGEMVYDWGLFYAVAACLSKSPEQAIQDIAHFRQLVPESLVAQDYHLYCLTSVGHLDEAQRVLQTLPMPNLETPFRGAALQAFLLAARARTPAHLQEARRLAFAKADQGPINFPMAISWLSALELTYDALTLAQRWNPNAAGLNSNAFMFGPLTKNMRRDPRFMQLAARIGLVDYWRTSGHWPDYCSEPGWPYDCKAVAATLK
jgi:class 3 adenylate cyclase/TolB-like protein